MSAGLKTEDTPVGISPSDSLSTDDVRRVYSAEVDAQLKDPDLSLYEKKCILINREIDAMGMGRYQWYIWGLCGLGYLIDLLWAQAFGLVLGPMQQELGFGNDQTGNLSTSFSAGLTAGAFVWGVLVDIVGRRWAFNLTVFISSVFGLCLAIPDSYTSILVLTAFVGFGVGGNIPIDTTITLEFTPQSKRFLLPLLSIFQPIGVVVCSAVAYGYIPFHSCEPNFSTDDALPACSKVGPGEACCRKSDNMGWRYLLYTLGAITLFIFLLRFVVFTFQESPKFLIHRGRDAEAVKALHHVAKVNGRTCGLTLDMLQTLDEEHETAASLHERTEGEIATRAAPSTMDRAGILNPKASMSEKFALEVERYKMLFNGWQMTRLTILTWLTYIMDFWGFTVAGFYLPQILALKNASVHLSLKHTYMSYLYIYAPGVVAVALGAAAYNVPRLGRKWCMSMSAGLMGASIFLFATVNTAASNSGLSAMEYFFQSMFNAVLYGWTPEAFPAPVRGTASGVASFWGRLAGIVAPLIAQHLWAGTGDDGSGGQNINAVLYLAGGVTLGCVISTALLPGRLVGRESY